MKICCEARKDKVGSIFNICAAAMAICRSPARRVKPHRLAVTRCGGVLGQQTEATYLRLTQARLTLEVLVVAKNRRDYTRNIVLRSILCVCVGVVKAVSDGEQFVWLAGSILHGLGVCQWKSAAAGFLVFIATTTSTTGVEHGLPGLTQRQHIKVSRSPSPQVSKPHDSHLPTFTLPHRRKISQTRGSRLKSFDTLRS